MLCLARDSYCIWNFMDSVLTTHENTIWGYIKDKSDYIYITNEVFKLFRLMKMYICKGSYFFTNNPQPLWKAAVAITKPYRHFACTMCVFSSGANLGKAALYTEMAYSYHGYTWFQTSKRATFLTFDSGDSMTFQHVCTSQDSQIICFSRWELASNHWHPTSTHTASETSVFRFTVYLFWSQTLLSKLSVVWT